MASAGRILIMPKGDYDSSVTYEMLDLVTYNNCAWLAKKESVGIEPTETNKDYWQKLLDLSGLTVGTDKVEGLADYIDQRISNYMNNN